MRLQPPQQRSSELDGWKVVSSLLILLHSTLLPMNSLLRSLLIAFVIAANSSPVIAQYTLYKSRAGDLLISEAPDAYFSFDIPGTTVTPADLKTSSYPRFFSDAFYLEIIPIPIQHGIASSPKSDMQLLMAEFESSKAARQTPPTEITSNPVELGHQVAGLSWSFIPHGDAKRFYCLAFRSEKTVFLLKSGFAEEPAKTDPALFLTSVAKSFVRSLTPIPRPK